MKRLLALVSASFALCACNSGIQETPEQLAIQSVYGINSKVIDGSKTAAEVVAKLQSVRLNACPAVFVDSFRDYIKAWEKMSEIEKKMYAVNMQKAASDMASYMDTYAGKPQEAAVQLKAKWPTFAEEIDKANSAITKAFTDLQVVGSRYNAVYSNGGLF